ncbi:MAG: agmatinase [Clostridia bacterium]|nr:agmatinase [Clostridia bacterium]
MLKNNVETFLACDKDYEQARIVMFGAPFDSTTSFRPGTRFGPNAVRSESFGIETYSPYQNRDLEDIDVMDSGDIELRIGDTAAVLEQIYDRAAGIIADEKIPFMIGGEHLVTLGAFRAAAEKHPDIHIVHFDAHADLREDYLGVKLSHACVLRRCWEIVGDDRLHQYGIRSGEKAEFEFARVHTDMHPFSVADVTELVKEIGQKPVYLTLDLDVLDPSVFPGTGTPEPGGVTFEELRRAVTAAAGGLNVVACDVNELSPHYDHSGISTAAACKIIREILLAL